MTRTRQVGFMLEIDAPCARHVVYCPLQLAVNASQGKSFAVFVTMCECGTCYIVTLEPNGVHIRKGGPVKEITELYESLKFDEYESADSHGAFIHKRAYGLPIIELQGSLN